MILLFGVDVGLFTKSSVTHFERDSKGKVVEITRNGRAVDPGVIKMKTGAQLEREYKGKHPVPKQTGPKGRPFFSDLMTGLTGLTPKEREKIRKESEKAIKQLRPKPIGFVHTPWGPQPVFQQRPRKKPTRKKKKLGKK